jgi:abnormal spindle-like microcephaly-associated protein
MVRPQEATPCPSSIPSDNDLDLHPEIPANCFDYSDNTSQIDFTTEFQASLRAAKPRRRTTSIRRKRPGKVMDFAVHQDDEPKITHQQPSNSDRHDLAGDKLSILAQPAQRPRSRVNFAPENRNVALSRAATIRGNSRQIESSRQTGSSFITDLGSQPTQGRIMGQDFGGHDETIKKPARRGTVYIPTEDTTMPTVWMGVFSPIKDMGAFDENSVEDFPADLTGIAAQMAKKRGPRKSSVMAAPRRGPLRQSLRPPQESTISEDIPGQLTGKENLPPGHEATAGKKGTKSEPPGDSSLQPRQAFRRSAAHLLKKPRPSSYGPEKPSPTACRPEQSLKRDNLRNVQLRVPETVSEHDVNGNFSRLRLNGGQKQAFHSSTSTEAPERLSAGRIDKIPAKLIVPHVAQPIVDRTYPLLSEDIQNPSLYENNWLAHQEIAITQLLNNLFDAATDSSHNTSFARPQLLATYQDQSFVLLQKRLQAALLYGTLSVPKETLIKSSRLPEDLGLKQKFLSLWLNTYDLQALQACAEVVIGRECSSTPRNSSASQTTNCSTKKKVSRQGLSRFLETFLIRNEDLSPNSGSLGPGITGLQRTLLRSLMLIKLLDKTHSPQSPFPSCLFQASSPHKSSVAVIQALTQTLHPSAGNIIRSLNHLDFFVSHVQYPLEEYDYHIENLAVDLRDGVKLTRLVELLLFPSASHLFLHVQDADATTTVMMPTGEILSLLQGEHDWPLSQHLKLPCLGRATKIFNVQIALSALSGIKGVGKMVEDITAEHIVDGFREKTVALLWGLASKWGLGSLTDWADLKREIRRLGGTLDEVDEDEEDELSQHKSLLKEWAAAAAAAAKKGLQVKNLTTSFADGRAFEAIVDEYEPYLPVFASKTSSDSLASKKKRNLSERLSALGCSAQFGKPFLPIPPPLQPA